MPDPSLPRCAEDVLAIPEADIAETVRQLLDGRALSRLVRGLHEALSSDEAAERARAREALERLGFVE